MLSKTLPTYAPAGAFCHTAEAILTLEVALTAAVKPVATTVTIGSTVKAIVFKPLVSGTIALVEIAGVRPLVHLYGIVSGADLSPAAALGSIAPKATAAAAPENLQMLCMVAVTAVVWVSAAEAKPDMEARTNAATSERVFMSFLCKKIGSIGELTRLALACVSDFNIAV